MSDKKNLEYYKNNCLSEYPKTPISVLRYITELEDKIDVLNNHSVLHSIIGRYCQKLDNYAEENQMKYQSKTNDQERSITAGMILATKKIKGELESLINDR